MGKREKGKTESQEKDRRFFLSLSPFPPFPLSPKKFSRGFSLIELVITMTVLSILTLGVVPLVKTSVKRAREQQLRDTLRGVREAIKEFRRDGVGVQCG
ncbi:MAG TPA: type II secretion system protein, partial [Pyrinomonadaceae bacterium]|nr:type II secretion system protein [Pyrinomonadaceae bacterium]